MLLEEKKTTSAEALLGILSLGPMSGYAIRQTVESSIGNFWSESFGQIYPALKRLESVGAISSVQEGHGENGGRPQRVFTLTAEGRERLARWLGLPVRRQVPRNELLLKLFFGPLAVYATQCEQVLAARASYVEDLARFQGILAAIEKNYANHPGLPYWVITLRYGMAEAEALVGWADETLATLGALEKKARRAPHAKQTQRRSTHVR